MHFNSSTSPEVTEHGWSADRKVGKLPVNTGQVRGREFAQCCPHLHRVETKVRLLSDTAPRSALSPGQGQLSGSIIHLTLDRFTSSIVLGLGVNYKHVAPAGAFAASR